MAETTNASVGLLVTLRQTVAPRYFLAMAVLLLAIVAAFVWPAKALVFAIVIAFFWFFASWRPRAPR